jgi:hypothetical protein
MDRAIESLLLWRGDSSGTQEGERPPLETGTTGLVMDSRPRGLSVHSELQANCVK